MQPQQPVKACPKCGRQWPLHLPMCSCGHQFRTQFPPPGINTTQVMAPAAVSLPPTGYARGWLRYLFPRLIFLCVLVGCAWGAYSLFHKIALSGPAGNWESISQGIAGQDILVLNRDGSGWTLSHNGDQGTQDADLTWSVLDQKLRIKYTDADYEQLLGYAVSSSGERMTLRATNGRLIEYVRLDGDPPPRPSKMK